MNINTNNVNVCDLNDSLNGNLNDEKDLSRSTEKDKKRGWKDMFPDVHPNAITLEKYMAPEKKVKIE